MRVSVSKIVGGAAAILTVVGGLILIYQFATGHQSLRDAAAPLETSSQNSRGVRLAAPVMPPLFVSSSLDVSRMRLVPLAAVTTDRAGAALFVFRSGAGQSRRVSRLYGVSPGVWRESVALRLNRDFTYQGFHQDHRTVALTSVINQDQPGSSLNEHRIEILAYQLDRNEFRTDTFSLRRCEGGQTSLTSATATHAGYILYIETPCSHLSVVGRDVGVQSTKAYGAISPTPILIIYLHSSSCAEGRCISVCSTLSESAYEDHVWRYGHVGAPDRCEAATLESMRALTDVPPQ